MVKNIFKKPTIILLSFLLLILSIAWILYVQFFQPGTAIVSTIRIIATLVLSFAISSTIFGLIFYYKRNHKIDSLTLKKAIAASLGFSIALFFIYPFSNNYLFAPKTTVEVLIQGTSANDPVDVVWINNGLRDIPFSEVKLPRGDSYDANGIHILLDNRGKAEFEWQGRALDHFRMEVHSKSDVDISISVDEVTKSFSLNPEINSNLPIDISLPSGWFYFSQVFFGILFVFYVCVFLVMLWFLIKPERLITWLEKQFPDFIKKFPISKIALMLFSIIAAWMIWIGFNNRMYADDFGYAATFRDLGYIAAVKHYYLIQNGRFMSHILDFAVWFLGRGSIPLGPIIVIFGLGGSVWYFIHQILQFDNRNNRLGKSVGYSLILIVLILLLQPDLYESTYWTLHALIVAGGLGLSTFAFGMLVRKISRFDPSTPGFIEFHSQTRNNPPRNVFRRSASYLGIFMLGLISAGFNEAITIYILVFAFILFVLIRMRWLVREALYSKAGSLIVYFLGAITGLILVVFGQGNQQRASILGLETNITSIMNHYVSTVSKYLSMMLFADNGIRIVLIAAVILLGYHFGINHPRIFNLFKETSNPFERLLIIGTPIIFALAAISPAGIVQGYYPERTLFIPTFIIAFWTFFIAAQFGSASVDSVSPSTEDYFPKYPKTGKIFSLILLIVIAAYAAFFLSSFQKQMGLFAKEWDAREKLVLQALEKGKPFVFVDPFKYTFGTDLTESYNKWLYDGMKDYYRIQFVLNRQR